MKFRALSFLMVFLSFGSAQTQEIATNCPDVVQSYDNVQVQQLLSASGKRCYLRVHPRNASASLIYRDYLITSDGLLLVFNSFSDQFNSTSDGARQFYFFIDEFKGFAWSAQDNSFELAGFGQKIFKFSLRTAQLESLSGSVIQVAEEVIPENRGGVEILKNDQPWIDAGFKLGQAPTEDRKAKSSIRNSQNQSCSMVNSLLFNYVDDSVYMKPIAQMQKLAQEKCPKFIWK